MQDFVCYGGPVHGQSVKMLDGSDYLVPRRPVLYITADWKCTDRVERPTFNVVVYKVQIWSYGSIGPRRTKSYKFLLAEDYKLTLQDQHKLEDRLRWQKWQFPQVSFINEFDEWFAQSAYRHTGHFYWKGKRVWDQ